MNLGNTCFFNSIVQCLLHTHSLSIYVNLVGKQEYVDIPSMKVVIADKTVQVGDFLSYIFRTFMSLKCSNFMKSEVSGAT